MTWLLSPQVGAAQKQLELSKSQTDGQQVDRQQPEGIWPRVSGLIKQQSASQAEEASGPPGDAPHSEAAPDDKRMLTPPLPGHLGDFVAAAAVHPAPRLPKGHATLSKSLSHTLGRPVTGSTLLVYACPEEGRCEDNPKHSALLDDSAAAGAQLDLAALSISGHKGQQSATEVEDDSDTSRTPQVPLASPADGDTGSRALSSKFAMSTGQGSSREQRQVLLRLCSNEATGLPASLPSSEDASLGQGLPGSLTQLSQPISKWQGMEDAARWQLSGRYVLHIAL